MLLEFSIQHSWKSISTISMLRLSIISQLSINLALWRLERVSMSWLMKAQALGCLEQKLRQMFLLPARKELCHFRSLSIKWSKILFSMHLTNDSMKMNLIESKRQIFQFRIWTRIMTLLLEQFKVLRLLELGNLTQELRLQCVLLMQP